MTKENKIFAETLKIAREASGLEQGQLAAKVGMSRCQLNHVERGRRLPCPVSQTKTIAAAVGANQTNTVRLMALAAMQRGIDAEALAELDFRGAEILVMVLEALQTMPDKKMEVFRRYVVGVMKEQTKEQL